MPNLLMTSRNPIGWLQAAMLAAGWSQCVYNEQLRGPYFLMHGVAMLISLEGGGRVGSIAASMCIISRKTCIFFFHLFLVLCFVLFLFFAVVLVFCRRDSIFKGCLANLLVFNLDVCSFGTLLIWKLYHSKKN